MKDRSPCISCKHRSPGCQSRCQIGIAYFRKIREQNDKAKEIRQKELAFYEYKGDRVFQTKKKYGIE